jgi:hypothetical protein
VHDPEHLREHVRIRREQEAQRERQRTLLDQVGVEVAVIGDSTGRLAPDYLTAV